jgi:hypothetical protein
MIKSLSQNEQACDQMQKENIPREMFSRFKQPDQPAA